MYRHIHRCSLTIRFESNVTSLSCLVHRSISFSSLDVGNNFSTDVPIFSLILLSIVLHSFFFYLLPSALTPTLKSHVVSTLHACVCVFSVGNFFARYSVDLRQMNRIAGSGMKGTGDEMMIYSICYTLGYFIYDTLLMFAFKSARTASAMAHHFLVLLGLFAGNRHSSIR